jgi:hypothetical protein
MTVGMGATEEVAVKDDRTDEAELLSMSGWTIMMAVMGVGDVMRWKEDYWQYLMKEEVL